MSTEDFGESHKACMASISEASMDVVTSASALLIKSAEFAGDGSIDDGEKKQLMDLKDSADANVKTLAIKFDAARKKFGKGISQELLSESFFVFVLSAYARKAGKFAVTLCTAPPSGVGCGKAFIDGVKGTFS